MAETALGNEGELNGTTPVTLMAAPAASAQRIVRTIGIHNLDTIVQTVTIRKVKGANTRVLAVKDLDPGDTLIYGRHVILDATDESITAVMGAAATSDQPDWDVAALEVTP